MIRQSYKSISSLMLLCCLFFITACSTRVQLTEHNTHRQDKLAMLSSYCWATHETKNALIAKVEPTGGHHITFDQLIRDTADSNLADKGFFKAECASADFVVDYRMGLHEDVAALDDTYRDDEMLMYGPRWAIGDRSVSYEGLTIPDEQIINVRHGTLHFAAFSKAEKILWHVSAEKKLNDRDSEETRRAGVADAINKIFATFPKRK